MVSKVNTAFDKALAKYVRRVGQSERTLLSSEVVIAVKGPRYYKIVRADKKTHQSRSAISFVDRKPGPMQGSVYISASWAAPRKYHVDNIFHPRDRVPGR